MRRLTLRPAVAALTFVVGITAASFPFVSRQARPKTISVAESRPAPPAYEKRRTYQHKMQASGYYGTSRACFGVFSSSDGMDFSSTDIYFNSPARAKRELRKKLEDAIEIIKREPLVDRDGREIGERVLATFKPYEGSHVASAEVIRAQGSDFGYVSSSSLQNILEYEKDHRR